MHTTWSRFCTVNHQALASNYQPSNMKYPGQDLYRQPQRLKASDINLEVAGCHVSVITYLLVQWLKCDHIGNHT